MGSRTQGEVLLLRLSNAGCDIFRPENDSVLKSTCHRNMPSRLRVLGLTVNVHIKRIGCLVRCVYGTNQGIGARVCEGKAEDSATTTGKVRVHGLANAVVRHNKRAGDDG